MKKLFLILIVLLFSSAFAADSSDVFDMPSTLQRDMDYQKIIAPQDYEKLIKQLKGNTKKKKSKQKVLMPDTVPDEDTVSKPSVFEEKYVATLMVPVVLVWEKGIVPVGYYKVCALKDESGNLFLSFYQGTQKIADIPAFLTRNTYDEETINYVRILPYDEKVVKIIYGSIDYNLETLVRTF